jgi:HlyD family secretion protein
MKMRVVLAALVALAGCARPERDAISGYGEAQYVYLGPMDGGRVDKLLVKEGDTVAEGAVLAELDPERVGAAAVGAGAVRAAQAGSARALDEAVRRAEAEAALARANLTRTRQLHASGFVAKARLDIDEAAARAADAAVAQTRAERTAGIRRTGAASADERIARARVEDAAIRAPAAGRIERIFRRPGEIIGPGEPVFALLPPANLKVRFFVPEPRLAQFAPGARVAISCDGCSETLTGRVTFVASEPQFTPPVIYSLEERSKLVFLAEAVPDKPDAIRPGLPVDVRLAP